MNKLCSNDCDGAKEWQVKKADGTVTKFATQKEAIRFRDSLPRVERAKTYLKPV